MSKDHRSIRISTLDIHTLMYDLYTVVSRSPPVQTNSSRFLIPKNRRVRASKSHERTSTTFYRPPLFSMNNATLCLLCIVDRCRATAVLAELGPGNVSLVFFGLLVRDE